MKAKNFTVYAGLILAMFFWSIAYIWIKIVYRYLQPISVVYVRLVAAAIILYTFAYATKKLQKIKRRDWGYIALMTFFHPFLYFIGESFGLKFVSSTVTAVIISTIPIFTAIAAFYLIKERLSMLNILGMSVSFIGVMVVVVEMDFSLAVSIHGVLLLFLAVFSGVAFTISIKQLSSKYNAITLVTYQNVLGILWFTPLFLFFELKHFLKVTVTMELVLNLAMLVIFASIMAFLLFTRGVANLGASKAGLFSNIIPISTALFAWAMLGESMTGQKITGILIATAGLFLAQLKKRRKNKEVKREGAK